MKCHCGLECSIDNIPEHSTLYKADNYLYYRCAIHGFEGWVNTKGFELLE